LFFGFLFKRNFLHKFALFFLIENSERKAGKNLVFKVNQFKFKRYYAMTDINFRIFMYKIVQSIEPLEIPKG